MKRKNNAMRLKFILACSLFFVICALGTPAAFADTVLTDRNGEPLTADNFPYYQLAADTFAADGAETELSLDMKLQTEAQRILEEKLASCGDGAGCAVILDAGSGAPLALAVCGEGADPLRDSFSPGNLFLPCTALAAFSHGLADADMLITCEGAFRRYEQDGFVPECWIWSAADALPLSHGEESLATALRDSCQYYFYTLGSDLGIKAMSDYARGLGLGLSTGIELPESVGVLASWDCKSADSPWNIGDTLEAAVGRSFHAFTPLQLARYCAAIVNDGSLQPASLLAKGDASEAAAAPELSKAFAAVREGMGARYAPISTHELSATPLYGAGDFAGLSHSDGSAGLFMGFAPADAPHYVICVAMTGEAADLHHETALDILRAALTSE